MSQVGILNQLEEGEEILHESSICDLEFDKQEDTIARAMALKDYSDLHRTIEDIIAEGDKVWFLEKVTGTASSGKKMDATSLSILRIVSGKFVEGWGGYIQKTPQS